MKPVGVGTSLIFYPSIKFGRTNLLGQFNRFVFMKVHY